MTRRSLIAMLVLATVTLSGPGAHASVTKSERARLAAHFLVGHQSRDGSFQALSAVGSTADAIVSLVAARRGPRAIERAVAYLEDNESEIDTVGELAKVVLALSAAGSDPGSFGSRDLVAEIEASQQLDGRYGASTSVLGHALAMLALEGAGSSATLTLAGNWLIDAQCRGGGWQYLEPPTPAEDEDCSLGPLDVDRANADTTAIAVQALEALPAPLAAKTDPFAFFDRALDEKHGGWGYGFGIGTQTNTNSTALVLQAYSAADLEPPGSAAKALVRLQGPLCGANGGGFYYTWGDEDGDGKDDRVQPNDLAATIAAIPGLLMSELPQPRRDVTRDPPRPRSCRAENGRLPGGPPRDDPARQRRSEVEVQRQQ